MDYIYRISYLIVRLLILCLSPVYLQKIVCPEGWNIYGANCYKVFSNNATWRGAKKICERYGSELTSLENYRENVFINDLLQLQMMDQSHKNYWIGMNTIGTVTKDVFFWSDGQPASKFYGFWNVGQPSYDSGDCVQIIIINKMPSWSLISCETKLPFICRKRSCPQGSYICNNGQCLNTTWACDGQEDCDDGSDENDCSNFYSFYKKGSEGIIQSNNISEDYKPFIHSKWTLEGPIGSLIKLQFTFFSTENEFDVVQILVGSNSEQKAFLLATLSGDLKQNDSTEYISPNNFLIVKFTSDSSNQKRGFIAQWKSVSQSCGGLITASSEEKILTSPNYNKLPASDLDCIYIIEAPVKRVITLEIKEFDLNEKSDFIYVRNGQKSTDSLLAILTGNDSPPIIQTTSNFMYLYINTSPQSTASGFILSYKYGCDVKISKYFGRIFSPGYGILKYPKYQNCTWQIAAPEVREITLTFEMISLSQGSTLEVFFSDYISENSTKFHSLVNNEAPIILKSKNGKFIIRFTTTQPGTGWLAYFYSDCPSLTSDNYLLSSDSTIPHSLVTLSCPKGQEFFTKESNIVTMCLDIGHWNISFIPKCLARFCGQVPQIVNGFPINATGIKYQDVINYKCYDGFHFASFKQIETVDCMETGEWESIPVCHAVLCPTLSDMSNSTKKVVNGDGKSYGSIVKYNCDTGYEYLGVSTLFCQSNGVWSNKPPNCQKTECFNVPKIKNGFSLKLKEKYYFNDYVTFSCKIGFKLIGKSEVRCGENRTFTEVPVCEDIDECQTSACDLKTTTCLNYPGGYYCNCQIGYQSKLECQQNNHLAFDNKVLNEEQITVSGMQNGFEKHKVFLNTEEGWCGNETSVKENNWIQFDMKVPTVITHIQIQRIIRNDKTTAFAKKISLIYSNNLKYFKEYTDSNNKIMIFDANYVNGPPTVIITLPKPLEARYIRLQLIDWEEAPCLKLEFEGCRKFACQDIDECSLNKNRCDHICTNTIGSYLCSCKPGFTLYKQNGTNEFFVMPNETGQNDKDIYQIDKTCVPMMCSSITAPENGFIKPRSAKFYFKNIVTFFCKFGYVLKGNKILYCNQTGQWNGTVPLCEVATCSGLSNDSKVGLIVSPAEKTIAFGMNVSLSCNKIGFQLKTTDFSNYRQCVFDPQSKDEEYWLSGKTPTCERIDCGPPLRLKGMGAIPLIDAKFGSSFTFTCLPTYKLFGSSPTGDKTVYCTEKGNWDFGSLRCEGSVCVDPGNPIDGIQISNSYEQESILNFTCLKPGHIPSPSYSLQCIENTDCNIIYPLGITSGVIPDQNLNATSQISDHYSAKFLRLLSSSGWCGAVHGFTYLQIDLNSIYQVKGFYLKGVMTNSIIGRITEFRLLYKVQEHQSFQTYPENIIDSESSFAKVSVIYLNNSIKARYIALGIVRYNTNACMKLEVLGCNITDENPIVGWNATVPMCVDIQRPVFKNCPTHTIVMSITNGGLQPVNYTVPTAEDENGFIARLEVSPAYFHPGVTVLNDTTVNYTAFDLAGNFAICTIDIKVIEAAFLIITCPASYILYSDDSFGMSVEFNMNTVPINIPDNSSITEVSYFPTSAHLAINDYQRVMVTAIDVNGNEAKCAFFILVKSHSCQDKLLPSPLNGNKDCSQVDDKNRTVCKMACSGGFRFLNNASSIEYYCDSKDIWKPQEVIPDCIPEAAVHAQYEVITTISYTAFGGISYACLMHYRSILQPHFKGISRSLTKQCSLETLHFKVSIIETFLNATGNQMLIGLRIFLDPTVKTVDVYNLCLTTLKLAFDLHSAASEMFIKPLINVSRDDLDDCPIIRPTATTVSHNFTCSHGQIPFQKQNQILCLACPAGTFAKLGFESCFPCSQGTYQDNEQQSECKPCPKETFTELEGSKSIKNCQPVCGYGSYSHTGMLPCLECPENTYSNSPPLGGTTNCTICPPETFTLKHGAAMESECRGKCTAGYFSATGLSPCFKCPQQYYQPNNGSKTCLECPFDETTGVLGAIDKSQCKKVTGGNDICKNGGQYKVKDHEVRCDCPPGTSGYFCESLVSLCSSQPCFNGGSCENLASEYRCFCPTGYSGLNCQDEFDDCSTKTCSNGGMCHNLQGIGNFTCLCPHGYSGPNCTENVDPCNKEIRCFNGATCLSKEFGHFKCLCPNGWTGPLCNVNIDDCEEIPCLLKAPCTDLVNDFQCDCPTGFTGKRCELKQNLCDKKDCINGYCEDYLGTNQCICQPGWTGITCEVNINDCHSSPCLHNGTCIDTFNGFQCECTDLFTGSLCQYLKNSCYKHQCQNNGKCIEIPEGYYCECLINFTGEFCESNWEECQDDMCFQNNTQNCHNTSDGIDNKKICESSLNNPCDSQPCFNNASCSIKDGYFHCTCSDGWTGLLCKEEVNLCNSHPCQNGASCLNLLHDYFCICLPGYGGKSCEVTPNHCIGEPCQNNGICQNSNDTFSCTCPPGYAGNICTIQANDCQNNQCQNDVQYEMALKKMEYDCLEDNSIYCDVKQPNCSTAICPEYSKCIEWVDGVGCQCPSDAMGEHCQKAISEDYDLHFFDIQKASSASSTIPLVLNCTSFTITLWVRYSKAQDNGTYFCMYTLNSKTKHQAICMDESKVSIHLFPDSIKNVIVYLPSLPINDGFWHHIALTWEGQKGALNLYTDAVLVNSLSTYAINKNLPLHGIAVLGSNHNILQSLKTAGNGFIGYISQVSVWNRILDFNREIHDQVKNNVPNYSLDKSLIQRWSGFNKRYGKVEVIIPSSVKNRNSFTNIADKIPPSVKYCPSDVQIKGEKIVKSSWPDAKFEDTSKSLTVVSNFRSGQYFPVGEYDIINVAYDKAGNSAYCAFTLYVLREACPKLQAPRGGKQFCFKWGPQNKYHACSIICKESLKFSQYVPDYYVCMSDGIWRPKLNSQMKPIYPACSEATSAFRNFSFQLQFLTQGSLCNDQTTVVVKDQLEKSINQLSQIWLMCANSTDNICGNLEVNVICQKRHKRQNEEEQVFMAKIEFPASRDPISKRWTNETSQLSDIITSYFHQLNSLNFSEHLPGVTGNVNSLTVHNDYKCPEPTIAMNDYCVFCSIGTFYNNSSESCDPCPKGSYQEQEGQLSCKTCSNNVTSLTKRPFTTPVSASQSLQDCKESCDIGHYYNLEEEKCKSCGFGFYQPKVGQFQCFSCGVGKTTRIDTSESESQCIDECPAGQVIGPDGTCHPCPTGTYRTSNFNLTCVHCPVNTSTAITGAVSHENCTLPLCYPGSSLNKLAKQCILCPRGTYQPFPQQDGCLECPPESTTYEEGAIKVEECISTNECFLGNIHCSMHAKCLHLNSTYGCQCKPGFSGNGWNCTDLCHGYCKNDGICTKDGDSLLCECKATWYGQTCEGHSDMPYIAGGIGGGVGLIVIISLLVCVICYRLKRPKENLVKPPSVLNPDLGNFYYGPAYIDGSTLSHQESTYATYYEDKDEGWEMPSLLSDPYFREIKRSLPRSAGQSVYDNEDVLDHLQRQNKLQKHSGQQRSPPSSDEGLTRA